VVDHDPKFTSQVFRAFVKSTGSCLIVGSAYHKNTNAKVERTNGVIISGICSFFARSARFSSGSMPEGLVCRCVSSQIAGPGRTGDG
jgi:hypothetical protein